MKNFFYSIRGGRKLSAEEFQSHMALATRLENVGVLLGAGASKGAGGLTMDNVWDKFQQCHGPDIEWLEQNNFIASGERPNLELLLDRLEVACADAERREVDDSRLKGIRTKLRQAFVRGALLGNDLWTAPQKGLADERLSDHRRLLSRLVGNRQPGQSAPWIFTTNYDLAIEWSAEALGIHCANGFGGLHHRAFRPSSFDLGLRNIHAHGEARFGTYNLYLAKLHGSLSWVTEDDGTVIEHPSHELKEPIDDFLSTEGSDEWLGPLIFPSSSKFVQTTAFVHGEMIRRFTEFLSRPNSCLIINGYGFSDNHINRIVFSALQNPTLQVIIYFPQMDRCGLYSDLGEGETDTRINEQLKRLLKAQLPQVTVRGYGSAAYFDALADDLPEPALVDETSERARELERLIRNAANPTGLREAGPIGSGEH